uniref:Uncharacterized protein n=1 Tax=Bursaphelenchus xylophilus TaxID=6326 RepID=A0A1I7S6B7_BURXY
MDELGITTVRNTRNEDEQEAGGGRKAGPPRRLLSLKADWTKRSGGSKRDQREWGDERGCGLDLRMLRLVPGKQERASRGSCGILMRGLKREGRRTHWSASWGPGLIRRPR